MRSRAAGVGPFMLNRMYRCIRRRFSCVRRKGAAYHGPGQRGPVHQSPHLPRSFPAKDFRRSLATEVDAGPSSSGRTTDPPRAEAYRPFDCLRRTLTTVYIRDPDRIKGSYNENGSIDVAFGDDGPALCASDANTHRDPKTGRAGARTDPPFGTARGCSNREEGRSWIRDLRRPR